MDRLALIFDGMFDGVWLVAADGRTTYANGAMAELLGLTPNAMHGRLITDFLDKPLWPEIEGFLARQRIHAGERMELRLRREDGSDLFGIVAGSPITTPEGIHVGTMLNVSDVTGKRSLDAQLVQNQRLEAIGQFAGGIAHDFNNLLTAIHGFTELARARLSEGDPIREDLDQVLASSDRASAITRKLLAFTRRQVLIPMDVDPAQIITDLIPMLDPLLGDNVEVALDIAPGHAWIRVDPTQLEQVVVNLAINARDAMPAGGTVTIAIRDVEPTDPDRPDPDLSAGPFVRISVSDTGIGMDAVTRTKIFDPFYTTKGPGKGTGLGLATVFGIVAQSGGQITVETAPGKGSTFHIDLPRVSSGVSAGSQPLSEAMPQGSGVILLVEDEAAVREFARRSLEAAGYTVLVAAEGNEALQVSERWNEGIDVLLTDIAMPGFRGPELAARIQKQRSDIGVLFMSGYADEAFGQGNGLDAAGEFLAKPFSVDVLKRAVARAVADIRANRLAVAAGAAKPKRPRLVPRPASVTSSKLH